MRFAICNETFGNWPLEEALAFARDAGYTGWEVAPFMLGSDAYAVSADQRAAYRQAVERAGLEVIGLHWLLAKTEGYHLTTADRAMRERTGEYFRELARMCRDLGGEVLVLGSPQQRNVPPEMPMETAYANATEVLEGVVPELEACDVRLALEPLGPQEGNFMNTAAEARRLRERIGSDRVGLHLDVKAMSTEPMPIAEVIRSNADLLMHFHANDPNRQGPGMGEVAYEPIFEALEEIGYDGWVSVEVFDYTPGVERLVTESMENMQKSLSAVRK